MEDKSCILKKGNPILNLNKMALCGHIIGVFCEICLNVHCYQWLHEHKGSLSFLLNKKYCSQSTAIQRHILPRTLFV